MNFHKHLFIGVLLVFIDINIMRFDLLPDIIGYLFILNAFIKVTKPYAGLGVITTVILLADSIVIIFLQSDTSLFFNGEIEQYNLMQQLIALVVGAVNILNYACMFAVSNAIIPITDTKLPRIFITLFILMELVLSFIYYLTPDEILVVVLPLFIIIFITYIVFLRFLWRRSKMEPSKLKQSDDVSIDDVADDLI